MPFADFFKTCKFSVNPMFFVVMGAFIAIEQSLFAVMLFFAALMHEAGHIFTIVAVRGRVSHVRLMPFGIDIKLQSRHSLSYRQDILTALSGPFVNLFLLIIFIVLNRFLPTSSRLITYGAVSNLGLFAVNILPALPLDGGYALEAFCHMHFSYRTAKALLFISTLVVTALLFGAGLALLAVTGYNASLLFISVYLVLFLFLKHLKKT